MNNKPYLHKEKPLTQSIAQEIISTKTQTKTYTSGVSVTTIAKHMCETHEKNGGLPTEKDLEDIIESALRYLSQSGEANRLAPDIWIIPRLNQKIFGSGKHWVYLYYFDGEKKKAKSDSMSPYDDEEDHLFSPCKIGKTAKDPGTRVHNLTRGVPVPPHIGLLFRTDEHSALEDAIHGILTVRGRHLEKLQGKEWFLTNPREVTEIYDFIIRANPYLGL